MNAWLKKELQKQFNRAEKLGWLGFFFEAEQVFTDDYFDAADLMAIASRETNLDPKWLTKAGDEGNGFGLMQADKRSFPEFTRGEGWKDARTGILFGAKVLMQKWNEIERGEGKQLKVYSRKAQKWFPFVGKEISGYDAQKTTIAAYNAGLWSYYAYSNGQPIDKYTTGADYSTDVMARAKFFRPLLNAWAELNIIKNVKREDDPFAESNEPTAAPPNNPVEKPTGLNQTEAETSGVITGSASSQTVGAGQVVMNPPQNTEGNQTADQITNINADADAAKVDAAQSQPPTVIEKTPSTSFGAKVIAFFTAIFTGQYVAPQFLQDGVAQNQGAIVALISAILRGAYENRYLIIGVLVIWYVVKKANRAWLTNKIATINADPTKGNIVLVDPPKPKGWIESLRERFFGVRT